MHDDQNSLKEPSTRVGVASGSAAPRHRLDSGSAAQTERAGNGAGMVRPDSNTKEMRVAGMPFDEALRLLRGGAKVARDGWNGRGQYIECQFPDINSKMTRPYLFIHTVDGQLVPWVASQTDLLAYDWCLVREETVLVYGQSGRPESGHREEIGR